MVPMQYESGYHTLCRGEQRKQLRFLWRDATNCVPQNGLRRAPPPGGRMAEASSSTTPIRVGNSSSIGADGDWAGRARSSSRTTLGQRGLAWETALGSGRSAARQMLPTRPEQMAEPTPISSPAGWGRGTTSMAGGLLARRGSWGSRGSRSSQHGWAVPIL